MKDAQVLSPQFRLVVQAMLAAAVTVLPAAAKTFEANLSRTFAVEPGGTLLIDADRGAIEVTTTDKPEVSVEVLRTISGGSELAAQKVFNEHEVKFDQDGSRIEVRARFKDGNARFWNSDRNRLSVLYRVAMPKRFNPDLNTSAGHIHCGDVEGKVRARTAGGSLKFAIITGSFDGSTSAGSVDLARASGPVTAKTSGGSIHLGELGADTDAETSAGSITIDDAKAELKAKTSGGSITLGHLAAPAKVQTSAGSIRVRSCEAQLDARTAGGSIGIDDAKDAVRAETSAGGIKVVFTAQPKTDSRLSTAGGSIQIELPSNAALDLDAHTSGGKVECRLPITVARTTKDRELLQGKINGGGPMLVLKTSAGNITVSAH